MNAIILLIGVIILTNINCTANCIYEKDGKCAYESITTQTVHFQENCAYFSPKK